MKKHKTRKQLNNFNKTTAGQMTDISWWSSEFRSVMPKQDLLNKPKYKKNK